MNITKRFLHNGGFGNAPQPAEIPVPAGRICLVGIRCLPWLAAAEGETDVQPTPAAADSEDLALAASKADGYTTYIAQYADWNTKVPSIEIAGSAFSGSSGAEVKEDFRGLGKACAVIPDDGWVEWTFEVPQDGLYQVELTYMAADEASGDVELAATVDGALPFREMNAQAFKRRYVQSGEITTNKAGNDVKPEVTGGIRVERSLPAGFLRLCAGAVPAGAEGGRAHPAPDGEPGQPGGAGADAARGGYASRLCRLSGLPPRTGTRGDRGFRHFADSGGGSRI